MIGRLRNYELGGLQKEVVAAEFKVSGICLEAQRKTKKTSAITVGLRAKIWT
jgi:hypothetical protein